MYLHRYLERIPSEHRVSSCAKLIAKQLNKNNRYAAAEIEAYVRRVIANMSDDELSSMELSVPAYARKIQEKLEGLEEVYREKQFNRWLDSGKIVCMDSWQPAQMITPAETIDSIPYSLYEAEKDNMNPFERRVIDLIVGTGSIRWWHRIIEKNDFRLNGPFNHYPDFMVMTQSGKLLLIETKGDHLDGENSRAKLALGRKWQQEAGKNYRYFMVFDKKVLGLDGAYTLEEFIDVMKNL